MSNDKTKLILANTNEQGTDALNIQSLIYVFRDKQVMLDSDLAYLYKVETGYLNRAVKRNISRFPEDFCFQLTIEEYANLKCQIGIASSESANGYGGRRTRPYVFTEQGISMLASVLHSDVAVSVSIRIMRAFVELRHFISGNALLFERISSVELRQLEYQKEVDEKFEKVFEYISDHQEASQKVFFNGQIYDAFSLISSLIKKASTDIILIDGYVDTGTLDLLSKKRSDVGVSVYTSQHGCRLTNAEVTAFNAQYPALSVSYTSVFHDRFLILDHRKGYHIGASIKDAGRKCFAISELEDSQIIQDLINRLSHSN